MPNFTNNKDAYGHGIEDYFNGRQNAYEIVEREDGYIDISGGPPAYFREYTDWRNCEKQAILHARGRVLDIGCGAGRVLLYLMDKGFDVTGLDNSPLALKVCRKRGVKKLIKKPITSLSRQMGEFDTFIMFCNNFGLFGSFKRAHWLLRRMYGMSGDSAVILATSADSKATSLKEHLEYRKYNRKRGRMPGQLKIRIRYLKYCTPYFDYLLVSPEEMEIIVRGTGWKINKIYRERERIYTAVIGKE